MYGNYRGDVNHWVDCQKVLTLVTVHDVKRDIVQQGLRDHKYLLRYLSRNRAFLRKQAEQALSLTPVFPTIAGTFTNVHAPIVLTELESDQKEFAQNHAGVYETLNEVHDFWGFGLPSPEQFRIHRNLFSHRFVRPHVEDDSRLTEIMELIPPLYEPLWKMVSGNVKILEVRLADDNIWRHPPFRTIAPVEEDAPPAWDYSEPSSPHLQNDDEDEYESEDDDEFEDGGVYYNGHTGVYFNGNTEETAENDRRNTGESAENDGEEVQDFEGGTLYESESDEAPQENAVGENAVSHPASLWYSSSNEVSKQPVLFGGTFISTRSFLQISLSP